MSKAVSVVAGMLIMVGALSSTAFAATATACPSQSILAFPAWFNGLQCVTTNDPVTGATTTSVQMDKANDIWVVVLNIVQWLILAAGYVAVYFVVWGGFKYIIAQGEPGEIKTAKDTIVNAVIGLVIVLAAVAIVRTIQAGISGKFV